MAEKIYIVGVSMTPFGRHQSLTVKDLTRQAISEALVDAGCKLNDIHAAFYSNTTQGYLEGQHFIRGPIALRAMGFQEIPIITVENACASGSTALNLAVQFLRAGEGEIALAVGAEKMYSKDKLKTFGIFDSAWDIHTVEENKNALLNLGQGVEVPVGTTSNEPYSAFMDVYAAFARFHMQEYGTTQEQIAAVAAKNHQHSVYNSLAQYQRAFTIDEILAAPPIAYPLTIPMCSPVSDGASAVILCTEGAIKRYGLNRNRAVEVLASVIQSGSERNPEDVGRHLSRLAAKKAYERAGVGPKDISVAEVHDATAVGEIIQVENLGFCEFGEGGVLAIRGDTKVGGRIPVNPSGGLESKGHPLGATGLAQVYELVVQLRGEAGARQVENASLAIAENGGGLYGIEEAVCSITILSK